MRLSDEGEDVNKQDGFLFSISLPQRVYYIMTGKCVCRDRHLQPPRMRERSGSQILALHVVVCVNVICL